MWTSYLHLIGDEKVVPFPFRTTGEVQETLHPSTQRCDSLRMLLLGVLTRITQN